MYNQLKAATVDKIFFKSEPLEAFKFAIKEEKNPFLEAQIDISRFDEFIQNKFSLWTNPDWTQDQYLLHYPKPAFLEPKTGWGVSLNRRLIYPSLGFAKAPHVHKPDFIETYFGGKRKVTGLEKIISMRDTGEENYFHFFNDVLPKLFLLEEKGINLKDYTLVISAKLYSKHYFQYFLTNTYLRDLKWHVQSTYEWIKFNEAIFCKPYTHTKKYLDKAIALVKQESPPLRDRRIFLSRPSSSLRFIENLSELEAVLKKFNFEIIDTSQKGFEQQIQIFDQCRYLVAIHGAGISNIIFRAGKKLSLLEIVQPSPYIPFHYALICKLYGYDYDVMIGNKGKKSGTGGFNVNVKEFESKLSTWLTVDE